MADKTPKPKVPDKADDRAQSERFIETARAHDADETSDILDMAFKKLRSGRAPQKGADSDAEKKT